MKKPVSSLSEFDSLPGSAHVDIRTVAALFACAIPTVWRRSRNGQLPKPRKFGSSARWNVAELRAVLSGQSVEALQ